MSNSIQVQFSKNMNVALLKKQYIATEEEQKEQYNPFDLEDFTSYNPLYSKLFPNHDGSLKDCQLDHYYHINTLHEVTDNRQKKSKKNIFIKYSPLLDPVHYLIGKYKENFTVSKHTLPYDQSCTNINPRIMDPNNCAYVDGFFTFLSSKLLHEYNFCHGVDYYGSYICNQKKFKIDIADDFEYLQDSKHFMDTYKNLYNINHDTLQHTYNTHDGTYSHKPRIEISDTVVEINDCVDIVENIQEHTSDSNNMIMETVFEDHGISVKKKSEKENDENENENESDSDDSTNNSVVSVTTDEDENCDDNSEINEDDDEDMSEDEDEDEDEESETDYEHIYAYIYNFPVNMICMEKCDGTLDALLEDKKLNEKEMNSVLVQIIFMLLTYQKVFDFTHNDLHTNNIVYKNTSIKHIHYVYNKQTYVVPTYGKIYKLIDFGRSIYRFQKHIMYSDSFSKGNDANSQYNSVPYVNMKKPLIHPNKSFDLCRLACSFYDFVFDEEDETRNEKRQKKKTEIQKTIERWCTEDNGKNILYKSSGDERYPNFKLYKMIARHVHNHSPEAQLQYYICQQYLQKPNAKSTSFSCINIDKLPKLYDDE